MTMPDQTSNGQNSNGISRIDTALARIEAAIKARDDAAGTMRQRHATLRRHMADAVSALDQVIAKSEGA